MGVLMISRREWIRLGTAIVIGSVSKPLIAAQRTPLAVVVAESSPDEIAKYWIDRKIRGKKGPPRSVGSVGLLRRVVAKLEGAVAYLEPKHVEGPVRALRIDGMLPNDENYPISIRRS